MKIIFLITLFILTSCSSSQKKIIDYSHLSEPLDIDYIDQLSIASKRYLASKDVHQIQLSSSSLVYLEQIHERIVTNSELLFSHESKPKFYVVLNKMPFLFSLPRAQYFFSSGLIEKYLKSEELFIAALAAEIIKSDRYIYEKKLLIPVGYYSSEKMIQLVRLKPAMKYQINEWTYFVLKRAGFDPTSILNWIQTQNRNSQDFASYLGDTVAISKEEYLFKNFMAKQGAMSSDKKLNEANSSKSFYNFLNNIVREK